MHCVIEVSTCLQDTILAEDANVLCIIRDMTNPDVSTRFNLNLQASCTCQMLMAEVASKIGYKAGSFTLTYERPENNELCEVSV